MLPPHLRSTYKQYKEDTERIATWLAVTARALGFNVLKPTPGMQKPKQKKHNSVPVEYTIAIKDFTILASHISKHLKAPSKVSQTVLEIITRAIQARKDSNQWFQKNEEDGNSGEDGHAHFIGILEQVHDFLKPHSSHQAQARNQGGLSLTNMFAGLELENVSEDFERASAHPVPSSITNKKVIVRAQPMKDAMKLHFAAFALLSDMNRIRTFVGKLWEKYLAGKEYLVSVAVTADCAVDLVRRLEEDFFFEFSQETPKTVLKLLYGMECALMGIAGVRKAEGFRQLWHPVMRSTTQWLFYDVHEHFSTMAEALPSEKRTVVPYQAATGSPFAKVYVGLEDEILLDLFEDESADLTDIFQECCLLTNFTKSLPVEDELLKGVRNILRTRGVPLWTAFAGRLFLDVRNIMEGFLEVPFKQLQLVATKAKQSIEAAISNRQGCVFENWPIHNDMMVQMRLMHVIDQWILTDGYNVLVKRHMSAAEYPKEDFRVLRQHPLLCGLMAFNVHMEMLHCAIAYVNEWSSGRTLAHLYNAVRQENACKVEWADMESFMNTHAAELLFSNGRPETPEDFHKRYVLCSGAPIGRYAREKSRASQFTAFKRKKGGSKCMKEIGEISKALKPRYCTEGGFMLPTDEVTKAVWDLETVSKMLNAKHRATQDNPAPPWNASQLSPVDLLMAMQTSIVQELKYITFDYFTFHCTCWSILRAIEKLCRPMFVQCLEGNYQADLGESRLPWIVGYVFEIEGRAQTKISGDYRHAELAGFNAHTRIILPRLGRFLSQILAGPHVTLTQELEKVGNARLMFDRTLTRKDVNPTPVSAPSSSGKSDRLASIQLCTCDWTK